MSDDKKHQAEEDLTKGPTPEIRRADGEPARDDDTRATDQLPRRARPSSAPRSAHIIGEVDGRACTASGLGGPEVFGTNLTHPSPRWPGRPSIGFGNQGGGDDGLTGYNTHTIALQVPKSQLTRNGAFPTQVGEATTAQWPCRRWRAMSLALQGDRWQWYLLSLTP